MEALGVERPRPALAARGGQRLLVRLVVAGGHPRGDGVVAARLDPRVVGRVGEEEVDGHAVEQPVEVGLATGIAAEQPMVTEEPEVAGFVIASSGGSGISSGSVSPYFGSAGANPASIAARASESTLTSASSSRSLASSVVAMAASGSRDARTSRSSPWPVMRLAQAGAADAAGLDTSRLSHSPTRAVNHDPGIEPHEAPITEFPKQPSRKDGLGTMCAEHWRAYVKGLREARVAATAVGGTGGGEEADAA